MKNQIILSVLLIGLILGVSCGVKKGMGLNFYSVKKDLKLGKRFSDDIHKDQLNYPLLPEEGNEVVYKYVRKITQNILATGLVDYKDKFPWEVKIIHDDAQLNAFATPGGYIFIYTGLIKFLDSEDQLAGVVGHEIAHAARRHSTRQLSSSVGVSVVSIVAVGVATGLSDPSVDTGEDLANISSHLINLQFSRSHEKEADKYSVRYLCEAGYNPTGIAGFFQKMEGQKHAPQFLSTHPNPGNRIKKIEKQAEKLGCTAKTEKTRIHKRMRNLLPEF